MWLGLSKSLGGGFRVGVGTRIGTGSKGRSNGPTQSQIAKYEKAAFLKNMAEEANQLLQEFLVNQSIDPAYINKKNIDIDLLFIKSPEKENYEAFVLYITELKNIIDKVNYGGSLTASRKDKLIDLIFNMREVVENTGPGLNLVAEEISKRFKKISIITFSSIFSILSILVAIVLLFGETGDRSKESNWFFIVIIFVLSAIIYFPVYLILKLAAKLKYRKSSLQEMKRLYGI